MIVSMHTNSVALYQLTAIMGQHKDEDFPCSRMDCHGYGEKLVRNSTFHVIILYLMLFY